MEKGSWTLGDKDPDFNCWEILHNALIFAVNTASLSSFPIFPLCIVRPEVPFLKLNNVSFNEKVFYVPKILGHQKPVGDHHTWWPPCVILVEGTVLQMSKGFIHPSALHKLLSHNTQLFLIAFRAWMNLFSHFVCGISLSFWASRMLSFFHRCGQWQHGLPASSQDQGGRHQWSDSQAEILLYLQNLQTATCLPLQPLWQLCG